MTTPDPQFYAPRSPSIVDAIATNKRVTDALLRNNPLTDAAVSRGLIRWIGNYPGPATSTGEPLFAFLQIGELPLAEDPNLGKPQRGVIATRDDPSRSFAFALADYGPIPGQDLAQTLRVFDRNNRLVFAEARAGGVYHPGTTPAWAPDGQDRTAWPGTNLGSEAAVWNGILSVTGNRLTGYIAGGCDAGTSGEVWLRVQGHTTRDSPRLTLASGGLDNLTIDMDVTDEVGTPDVWLSVMARRTGGSGFVRATPGRILCNTPDLA